MRHLQQEYLSLVSACSPCLQDGAAMAHSAVLRAVSKPFRQMLTGEMSEGRMVLHEILDFQDIPAVALYIASVSTSSGRQYSDMHHKPSDGKA